MAKKEVKKETWIKYIGVHDILKITVHGGGGTYPITRGWWFEVKDESDAKWFRWKAAKNPDDFEVADSKPEPIPEDIGDGKTVVKILEPQVIDPELEAMNRDLNALREKFRKYMGRTLPPELQRMKNVIEGGN